MAVLLGSLVCGGTPIIYIDETSIRAQDCPRKSWATREDPNVHLIDANGSLAVTVYGAIGACIPATFMLARSTNAADYQQFVRLVAGKLPADLPKKPVWFHDGHAAHTSAASRSLVAHYFRPLQNVPYTSEFNAIEYVWGLLKRDVRRRLLIRSEPLSEESFYAVVNDAIACIAQSTVTRLLRSNTRYIRKQLQAE